MKKRLPFFLVWLELPGSPGTGFSRLGNILLLPKTMSEDIQDQITEDGLFGGTLVLRQHRHGYRFSVDAVLLAHFLECPQGASVLDLGTGCGVIPLILLYRWGDGLGTVVGIEIQGALAKRARENLVLNGYQHKGVMVEGDFRQLAALGTAESFDVVLCNPPFYNKGCGRASHSPEANVARHQLMATLTEVFAAAAYAVRNKGVVAIVYPAEKIGEAVILAANRNLALKRLQMVYSYPEEKSRARLVLLEFRKNGGAGAEVLPPFYIYQQKNGAFTAEMENFYHLNGVFRKQ